LGAQRPFLFDYWILIMYVGLELRHAVMKVDGVVTKIVTLEHELIAESTMPLPPLQRAYPRLPTLILDKYEFSESHAVSCVAVQLQLPPWDSPSRRVVL
jgi:hypothetical protein